MPEETMLDWKMIDVVLVLFWNAAFGADVIADSPMGRGGTMMDVLNVCRQASVRKGFTKQVCCLYKARRRCIHGPHQSSAAGLSIVEFCIEIQGVYSLYSHVGRKPESQTDDETRNINAGMA